MGNGALVVTSAISVGIFSVLAKWTIELRAAGQFQRSWGTLAWGLFPSLCCVLYGVSQGGLDVTTRNVLCGLFGAATGASLAIYLGYVVQSSYAQSASAPIPSNKIVDSQAMPAVTGSGTTVISIGQTGGVTAGTYINQAAVPELRIISQSSLINADKTYTTTVKVQVIAQVTPANLAINLSAEYIMQVSIESPPQDGISTMNMANVRRSRNSFSADIPRPYGTYKIVVVTQKQTSINLDSHF